MNKEYWANLLLCCFLGGCLIFTVTKFGSAVTSKGLLVEEYQPSKEAVSFLKDVKLIQPDFEKKTSRQVNAIFSIQNNSDQDLKNITVLCDFFDEETKHNNREKWILHKTFLAGTEERVTTVSERYLDINAPVECRVADLEPVKKPLFQLHRSKGGHGEQHGGEAEGHAESHGNSHGH